MPSPPTWWTCPSCARRCSSSCCSRSRAACSAPGSCSAGSRSSPTPRARPRSRASSSADASGFSPPLASLAVALGYAGGVERAGRAGREPGEATALLLVAALAGGVILASDVFESGAAVDRLLFGTLLGLDGVRPRGLARRSPRPRGRRHAGARPHLVRARLRPGRHARARGCRPARADLILLALVAVAVVAAIPAVGALLVTARLRAARRHGASVRPRHPRPDRVRRSRSRSPRESLGLYLAYWLDLPPGPPVAVLGALLCLRGGAIARGARQRRHEPAWPSP